MSMVEKVARALFAEEWRGTTMKPQQALDDAEREYWFNAARAAIEAMREPSEEMVAAGDDWGWDPLGAHTREVWQAMLSAALKGDE
jgi:hypothetical protein